MSEEQKSSKRVGRIELLVLVLVFISPILGAWIIYIYTDIGRGDSINHGNLLDPPVRLQDVSLHSPAGGSEAGNLLGKWSLIYILPDACEATCRQDIQMLQKLKLSLAQNSHRLQLVVANNSDLGAVGESGLATQVDWGEVLAMSIKDDFIVTADKTQLPDIFEREYLLVDPAGNLMMRYNRDSEGAGILQDIKRLLRYSRIG